jgi:hypothetical protein
MGNGNFIIGGFGGKLVVTGGFGGSPPSFTPTLFDAALQSYLVSALGMPVWSDVIPQNNQAYPQLVYTIVVDQPYDTMDAAAGLVDTDVQIDIWGPDFYAVDQTEEALRQALEGFRGMMGDCLVSSVHYVDASDDYEASPIPSDGGFYRKLTEWTFKRFESIPTF